MKTKQINATAAYKSHLDFGFFDASGREFGMSAWTWECDFVEQTDPKASFYQIQPGHYFVARTQATRNGKKFGAWQRDYYFATKAERDSYLAKRWADSLKNAQKKAA